MATDAKTGEIAYFHFSVDIHESETAHEDDYVPTNFFLRAELAFFSKIEEDAFARMNFAKGECADSAAAAPKKYQLKGLFNKVYDLWMYVASSKGYKYHFGIALNPITIHQVKKRELIYTQFYAYQDFEFEGQKPFAHITFEKFDGPAGCLNGVGHVFDVKDLD